MLKSASDRAADPGLARTAAGAYDWRLTLGFWLIIALVFIVRAHFNAETTALLWDTDDAMRMSVVRDFLAGQNWYDHTQYRINTPFGADIHWSRLVDVPIAALIILGKALFGANGETVAVYVWPLFLLFLLLALSARLAVDLVGRQGQLPGLVLPVLSVAIMTEFAPGRIDHHSVQIVLAIATVLASIRAELHPRWGLAAALLVATSLAIGTETIPFAVAAFLAFGLAWVVDGRRAAALRQFGLGLIGFAALHFIVALPPSQWFAAKCDAYSLVYASALVVTGLGMIALSLLPRLQTLKARLAAGILAGALVTGLLVALFPQCLNGPYEALDPWLVANWLDRITEAKPVWQSFAAVPAFTLGVTLPPLLAILATAIRFWRGPEAGRAAWAIYAVFLVIAVAAFIPQVRGARLAAAMAVPAGAFAIVAMRTLWLDIRRPIFLAGLVLSWLGFASIPILMLTNLVIAQPDKAEAAARDRVNQAACRLEPMFKSLEAGPPLRIMTPVDLGSHMILYTPNSVVGAPYHRNADGVRDTFRFFNDPQATAKRIARERGLQRVVICPYLPEMQGIGKTAPDALLHAFAGEAPLPDWLVDITPPDTVLKIYDVRL